MPAPFHDVLYQDEDELVAFDTLVDLTHTSCWPDDQLQYRPKGKHSYSCFFFFVFFFHIDERSKNICLVQGHQDGQKSDERDLGTHLSLSLPSRSHDQRIGVNPTTPLSVIPDHTTTRNSSSSQSMELFIISVLVIIAVVKSAVVGSFLLLIFR